MLRISSRVCGVIFALELGGVEGEVARFAQEERHRHGAVGDDLRLVDREARHRIDDLVAGAVIGHRGDRVGDEGLRAAADDDVLGSMSMPRRVAMSRAAAARSSSIPADGV